MASVPNNTFQIVSRDTDQQCVVCKSTINPAQRRFEHIHQSGYNRKDNPQRIHSHCMECIQVWGSVIRSCAECGHEIKVADVQGIQDNEDEIFNEAPSFTQEKVRNLVARVLKHGEQEDIPPHSLLAEEELKAKLDWVDSLNEFKTKMSSLFDTIPETIQDKMTFND